MPKYDVHLEGECVLVHQHTADLAIDADSEEEARIKALDQFDSIKWNVQTTLDTCQDTVELKSITATPVQ